MEMQMDKLNSRDRYLSDHAVWGMGLGHLDIGTMGSNLTEVVYVLLLSRHCVVLCR
jgi:hypothetical protein